jgi:hypothetical protein
MGGAAPARGATGPWPVSPGRPPLPGPPRNPPRRTAASSAAQESVIGPLSALRLVLQSLPWLAAGGPQALGNGVHFP